MVEELKHNSTIQMMNRNTNAGQQIKKKNQNKPSKNKC